MHESSELPASGVYVLLMRAAGGERVEAGAWGSIDLMEGYYAYVGRAKRGLAPRLARHGRREGKRLRWHVDYLLHEVELLEAWIFPFEVGECSMALMLEEGCEGRRGLEGFGASDCRCPGHLVYLGKTKPTPPRGQVLFFAY